MEKKKYSIQVLADILGVSVAAIRKKINNDEINPNEKRYKKRYEVVVETLDGRQVMLIMLSDTELQDEIRLAKINKTKHSNEPTLQETFQETLDENVIEAEYTTTEPNHGNKFTGTLAENVNALITLTERYNESLETYRERLSIAEQGQKLLEDKAARESMYLEEIKTAKEEITRLREQNIKSGFDQEKLELANKEVKKAKNVTRNVVIWYSVTLLITLLMLCAAVGFLIYKLNNPTIVEKQIVIEKQVPASAPAQPKKNVAKTYRK